MPLDFAEFAHHYEGSSMGEAAIQAEFEIFASALECIARYYWQRPPQPNRLGITLDSDTISLVAGVECENSLHPTFNRAASEGVAGKTEHAA